MKKSSILTSMLALVVMTMMSSCLGDTKNEYKQTVALPYYFNQIVDNNDPDGPKEYLYSDVSYTIEYNFTNMTMVIGLNGLTLPNGTKYPAMMMEDVPFKINADGWAEVSLKDYTPTGIAGYVKNPEFKYFKLKILDRYIGGSGAYDTLYSPYTDISYSIDNYEVHSMSIQLLEYPKTEVYGPNDSKYEPDPTRDPAVYVITFDIAKREANVAIQGAKFDEKMPALNMRFSGIPFTFDANGVMHMEKAELIPSLITGSGSSQKDTPAPSYPITNLTAVYDQDYGFSITYTCTPNTPNGSLGDYTVHAVSKYPSESNQ